MRLTLRELAEDAGYDFVRTSGNRALVRDDEGRLLRLTRKSLEAAEAAEAAYADQMKVERK